MPRLPPKPDLEWSADGAPASRAFGDVYFSRAGGLAETEAVFLAGCGLPEAWAGKARFTILELGFGTGLNALAAWRAWAATRAPGAVLHFISIESAPFDAADAGRALAQFSELEAFSFRLLARWPVRARAPQRIWFEEDGFALTLLHEDAERALGGLATRADAIFLDGFAPARNPAMWSAALMQRLAARAAPGARLATYSVAGAVRRALEAAGFAVEKKPGFGAKRERLEGRLVQATPHRPSLFPYARAQGRVAIIGGGIAGASLAHALKRRGRESVIFEAASQPGAGASGNPAALVMPRLDRGEGPASALHLAAFIEAVRLYEALGVYERRGARELPGARDAAALADLLADPPLPEDWLRADEAGGLHYARAGIVRPDALMPALLEGVEIRFDVKVARIERDGGAWRLLGPSDALISEAETIVLAAGASLNAFAQTGWLPVRLSRGQLEWGRGATMESAVVAGAYAAPLGDGIIFGATFDPVESDEAPHADADSRARNLAALARLAPDASTKIHGEQILSRASLRATLPDFMPIAGLMPHVQDWRVLNADIVHGRTRETAQEAPSLKGFYVFGGLGARGFTLAPLLAERLASELCDEPHALPQDVLDAVHPARFLLRALKRREGISS